MQIFSFIKHAWFLGHSVEVNRGISAPLGDTSKGWLHKCECGKVWAR